ncbi:hypothetical protein OS189_13560 [Sulfitobacter sp. F26169L]|uniref:hypothetical protein n=1 Tax=Sulfitobacter sp. F26169L TaxID=2996015 RepID=UPI00226099AB|nr:hypothetical protein [Sulfitobacter sp. F26169L]MCX7567372.1 hypothetical protein [Sulfitobacter sp. F26169L]
MVGTVLISPLPRTLAENCRIQDNRNAARTKRVGKYQTAREFTMNGGTMAYYVEEYDAALGALDPAKDS